MTKILGVIPARYASTRFPGKPLAIIEGRSMIQRVVEQVRKADVVGRIVVATDDERIFAHVSEFAEVMMTNPGHPSGTDRCYEVLQKTAQEFDYVINIQGDEPFIDPGQIQLLAGLLDGQAQLATLARRIDDPQVIQNPNVVKVVISSTGKAMYFSRSPIPYGRGLEPNQWPKAHPYYKHIGLYAYRSDVLSKITSLPPSRLELAESLEQLRWLENDFSIQVAMTEVDTIGIDTPEDLEAAVRMVRRT